jgi:hypothetical protein
MPTVPQTINLVGSTATDVAIDSTGTSYDGLSRLSWPFNTPNPYNDARLVVAGDATKTDAEADLILRDYNAGSDIATISGVDLDDDGFITKWDPNDIDGTADVGLRVDVTTASGTGGATVDLDAKVVLLP